MSAIYLRVITLFGLLLFCIFFLCTFFSLADARGNEIPDVPLSELIFRSLVDYLRTGRFTDCRHIALTYSYAESRALNAVQQQASAEDFAFHFGKCVFFNLVF